MTGVLLNALVAVPLGFALLTWLLGRRVEDRADGLAVSTAVLGGLLTFVVSLLAASGWADGLAPGGNVVRAPWIESMGIDWALGLDGISAPLVLMTTLVAGCCLFSLVRQPPADAEGGPRRRVALAVLLLVIEAGVLGAFLALDMVLFFLFFEVALIPMWFVINRWGDPSDAVARRRAATRFLVFTVTGSALMLVGFLVVRSEVGTFDIVAVAASYSPTGATAVTASVLVGLGLAVKTPLWPLHIWLPDAHAKAPTVGSVLLAAVLLKLGTYGFLRFWMPITSPDWELVLPLAAALAVVGIVYAALACLAQADLKRLIAYSSVGHMGFVVLGVASYTVVGVQAAVFASVAHGLITGLLFFLAGAIKDRAGTADMGRLEVLYRRVPRLAGLFAFAAMASLGLPGLAGFWGEMLAIRSALFPATALPGGTFAVLAVLAAFGVIFTSAYFLALLRFVMQGGPVAPAEPVEAAVGTVEQVTPAVPLAFEEARLPDVRASEWVAWSPLAALTLVLGLAPGLLLTPAAEAVRSFLGGL